MKLRKTKKGFTIVELVIVIGVIGILSAILIPTFVNLNSKASDAALKSDLAAVYSSYVADAADGYKGEPGSSNTSKLEMYGQTEVALVKTENVNNIDSGSVFYVYSTDNSGWNTETKTKSDLENNGSGNAKTLTNLNVEYSGYTVFSYLKATTASE